MSHPDRPGPTTVFPSQVSTLSEEVCEVVLVGVQSGDRPRDRGTGEAVRTACLCPTQTGLGPLQSSLPKSLPSLRRGVRSGREVPWAEGARGDAWGSTLLPRWEER